jgi:hypothetical protein
MPAAYQILGAQNREVWDGWTCSIHLPCQIHTESLSEVLEGTDRSEDAKLDRR